MQITLFNLFNMAVSMVLAILVIILWRRGQRKNVSSSTPQKIVDPKTVQEARSEYQRALYRMIFFAILTIGVWGVMLVMLHIGGLIAPWYGKHSQALVSTAGGVGMLLASLNLRGWWKSYGNAASKLRILLKRWDAEMITDLEAFKNLFDVILTTHGTAFEKALEDMTLTASSPPAPAATPSAAVGTTTTTTIAAASTVTAVTKPAKS